MAERQVRLITKRTSIPGKIPTGTTGDESSFIRSGELASNLADKKLWGYDGVDVFEYGSESFLGLTGGTIIGDLNVTGNSILNIVSATTYFGDGSNLTGISGSTDTFVTGFTYTPNSFTISQSDGSDYSAIINELTGLTISGDLNVSGESTFNTISVDVLSATTIITSSLPILTTKAGIVSGGIFSGNPKKATILFSNYFEDNDYTITVTGEDSRSWRVESKSLSGFTINAGANLDFAGNVFWQAIKSGESDGIIISPQNIDGGNATSIPIDLNIDGGGA
jgi:hypothetical protein